MIPGLCPGSGRAVTPTEVVLNGMVLCTTCRAAVPVEWVDQWRKVAGHRAPAVTR